MRFAPAGWDETRPHSVEHGKSLAIQTELDTRKFGCPGSLRELGKRFGLKVRRSIRLILRVYQVNPILLSLLIPSLASVAVLVPSSPRGFWRKSETDTFPR